MSITAEWIAVDWGGSRLRAWAMQGPEVLARVSSEKGANGLTQGDFAPVLQDALKDWTVTPDTPVLACGMVGARDGWAEAPYRPVPCPPLGAPMRVSGDWHLAIVPGLRQDSPADVMRGEETQIAGYLAGRPGWDGVICLPGTHAKWAQVSAGEVVSFRSFMTGELYALLSNHSILRHGLTGEGWDDTAFAEAVAEAMSRPEQLAARLFSLRAEGLLNDLPPAAARARLSGLLIGAELAAARPWWLGQDVVVLGDGPLPHATALEAQGVPVTRAVSEAATLAGLHAAYTQQRQAA
jgi:2-dehydro-3-deoxygalactonokinase